VTTSKWWSVAVVAGVLVLAGCGGDSGSASGRDLAGRTFVSTSATPALVAGTRLRVSFTDGHLSAQAGCNTMGGKVVFDGDTLVLTEVGQTEMGCEPRLMQQDERVAAFLTSKPTWSLDGDTLVLGKASTRVTLVDRKVAEPDRPLRGTTWVVEDTGDGDTVSHTGGPVATLQFDATTLRGSSGCNTVTAGIAVRDSTIAVTSPVWTDRRCLQAAPYEDAMRAVLQGNVTFAIDGDALRLTGSGGTSIGLRAGGLRAGH
jgi:heat shock protein HslJ